MSSTSSLPLSGIIRLKGVLKVFPVSKSTWWLGVKDGRYPRPVRLGPNSVGWRVEDLLPLLERGISDAT